MNRERLTHALTGAIALVLFSSLVYVGVLYTNGDRFKQLRRVYASFDAAGQGLQAKSDVKVHGVTIGSVKWVHLVNGRALVEMEINSSQPVPVDSTAQIEPKTLFGEKFVNIVPTSAAVELRGPFLQNGGTIAHTVATRGTELEDVLGAAYPILAKIDPNQLMTIVDTLAQAGQGEGPAINRQLGNFTQLANVFVAQDANTQQFLSDLATLTNSLASDSPNVVSLAQSLNIALPPLNARGDEVTSILGNLSRLSNDTANLLNANRPTQDKLVVEGGQILNTLVPRLGEVDPTIVGIRQFVQMLTLIGHIPYGQGQVLGAIKLILGGGCLFGQVTPCSPTSTKASPAAPATTTPTTTAPPTTSSSATPAALPNLGVAVSNGVGSVLPPVVKGVDNVLKLVGGLAK